MQQELLVTKLISRILIVGLGSAGTRHLRLARDLFPNAQIKILRHRTQNEGSQFSEGFFSTMEEAVQFAPQIAIIANPSTFHLQIAQELAEAGVHLLIEKPLSSSVNGVTNLIETCKEHKSTLMIGYNLRFSPSLQHFRSLLNEGIIGELLSVRCEVGQYLPSWRPESNYRQGVSAKKELGGGALLELSHEIDYLRWIFGEVEWVRATITQQSRLEIDVEDSAHLTMGFLPNSNGRQLVGVLNLDLIRHDHTRTCTVIGEKGTLRWNGFTGEVDLFEEGVTSWNRLYSHQPKPDETYSAELQDFVDSIEKKKLPFVTGDDGLRVLEIIEAARVSAATGSQEMTPYSNLTNRPSK
jgi:predicted dehydrogenase